MAKEKFDTMDDYIHHLYDTTPVCDDEEEHENPFSKTVIKARRQLLDDAFGEDDDKRTAAIRILRDKYKLRKLYRWDEKEGRGKTIHLLLEDC